MQGEASELDLAATGYSASGTATSQYMYTVGVGTGFYTTLPAVLVTTNQVTEAKTIWYKVILAHSVSIVGSYYRGIGQQWRPHTNAHRPATLSTYTALSCLLPVSGNLCVSYTCQLTIKHDWRNSAWKFIYKTTDQ